MLAPLAILGVFTLLRDEFLSETWQSKLQVLNWIPDWSWSIWLNIALGVVVFIILESAYRIIQKQKVNVISDEKLDAPHIEVSSCPENDYVRLLVKNQGESAEFEATGRIIEQKQGSSYPIQWRSSREKSQRINRGGEWYLNVAYIKPRDTRTGLGATTGQPAPKPKPNWYLLTARQNTGLTYEIDEFPLPYELLELEHVTIEVHITNNYPRGQPYSEKWTLNLNGDDMELHRLGS